MPSYRMTQRSIIHVPSPAPNLQPTPNSFYNRFRTPATDYPIPPSYNDRISMPIHPSSNERQSSQSSQPESQPQPQPQPPPPPPPPSPIVFSTPIPPPVFLSEPVPPMHLSQSRPAVSTNSPSFFPPIQPMPSAAQITDDRDNRYFSLHEPWPPAYTNTNGDKNTIKMTTSTEVQNDGDQENIPEDERNLNNNANNNNMAGPDDGRNELVDYPPGDPDYGQNYQENYDRPDYPANTDYRDDYQAKTNKPEGDGVTETVDEGNGGGIDDDYYQDYPNARDYNHQGKQVENNVAQPNLNYPSDSQEVVNYHNQDANDYQAGGQEPVYGDGYPVNELPNQSNEQKQNNYEDGNHQSSQSTSLPPSPQTDYNQDYADDYYSSGNSQGTSNEQTDVNNNQIDNQDNNEDDENQRNDNESLNPLMHKQLNQLTRERSTSGPPMDYPYLSDGYNEPSMSPFETTPMASLPMSSGTEPGVRPHPDPINSMNAFDLTGDPYLDNYGRSMREKSQPNSMENHINQIDNGDFGRRNQQYHFNNAKDSSSRPNDYPTDQQSDGSTPPIQSDYNNDWPMDNEFYQQNRQPMISQSAQPPSLQSPSSITQLDSNRELDNPIDRYDPEDWGQY